MTARSHVAPSPLAYLLTFRTYGTWLPGDPRGSTPKWRRTFGTPLRGPHEGLRRASERQLANGPVILDTTQREVVHHTLVDVCKARGWAALVVEVRTNHVHAVVSGAGTPEAMMTSFKARGTHRLQERGLVPGGHHIWSRHGSTRYLWTPQDVELACAYVRAQGCAGGGRRATPS